MYDSALEYALVVFPGNEFSGTIIPELIDLAGRGIVRYVDIAFVRNDADGKTLTVELNDLEPEMYRQFVPVGKQLESLFTQDDLEFTASKLPANSSAVLLLWENLWASRIRGAIVASGGRLAEGGRISVEEVNRLRAEQAAL